jgi:hypothetical protein
MAKRRLLIFRINCISLWSDNESSFTFKRLFTHADLTSDNFHSLLVNTRRAVGGLGRRHNSKFCVHAALYTSKTTVNYSPTERRT